MASWEQLIYQEEMGPRFAYRDPATGKESAYNFGAGKDILDQKGITEDSVREAMVASGSGPVEFSQFARDSGINLGGAMEGHARVLEQSLGDRSSGVEGAIRQYAPYLPAIGMGVAGALGGAAAGAAAEGMGVYGGLSGEAIAAADFGAGAAGASAAAGSTAASTAGAASSKIGAADLLLISSGVSSLASLAGGGPEAPSASGAVAQDMDTPRSSTSIANRDTDFETRRQMAGRAALAAGVTRNDNEVDLLGVVGRTTPRRAVGGQRRILGY